MKKEFALSDFLSHNDLSTFFSENSVRKVFIYYGIEAYDNLESNHYDNPEIVEKFG